MKIHLKEVRDLEPDKPCQSVLHCNTIDKSSVSQYKDGKFKATVWLADETDVLPAYVYDMEILELFSLTEPGPGIQISNFIPKKKYTNVYASSKITIPKEIEHLVQKKLATEMDTSTVAVSPVKTTVTLRGIITEISPVQKKKRVRSTGEEISFKRAILKDSVGEIPVCLWRELAENQIQKGDCIKVSNFSVSETFNDQHQPIPAISNKFETSSVEIIPDTNNWSDLLKEDEDITGAQKMTDAPAQPVIREITGIGKLNHYLSCANPVCYRKKLKDLKCDKCGLQHHEKAAQKSVVGSLVVNSERKYTFFTQHAESLKAQLNISDNVQEQGFYTKLVKMLPIKATIDTIGDKIMTIKVIE